MSGADRPWWRRTRPLRAAYTLLRTASLCVPRDARREWLEEWEGELWALAERPAAARALLAFALGGVGDAVRESILERREGEMGTTGLWQDVRSAARRLARAPGFTFVTVSVLALGIGVNTALFGALRSALLQAAPYPEPDRLVVVDLLLGAPDAPPDTMIWSYPKYLAVRDRMPFLSASAGYTTRTVTLAGAAEPVRVPLELVSPSYFELLGVEPAAGRTLQAGDAASGDPRVLVLAHHTWVEDFGADPAAVGRLVEVNGESFRIVGVARPGFRGLTGSADGWAPIEVAPLVMDAGRLEREWSHWFWVVGRLQEGTPLARARSMASALADPLTEAFPDPGGSGTRQGVALTPLEGARVNPTSRLAVGVVGVGAVLLLLIASANAAGLLLARVETRRADLAVRAALGAGRARLVREALAESLLLAGGGGVAGVLLAVMSQRGVQWAVSYALETSGSRSLQFMDPTGTTPLGLLPVIGLLLAIGAGVACGLVPARIAGRTGLAAALASAGRRHHGGAGRRPGEIARGLLVSAQLALTLVLLSGAGLMLASFSRLEAVALGFEPEGVLTARYELGPETSPDEVRAFEGRLVERLSALPEVEGTAIAVCAPLAGLCDVTGVREVDGRTLPDEGDENWMHTQSVTPGFFEVAGVALLRGRALPSGLTPEEPPRVVLSESAAELYFPGVDPIGHTIGVTHQATPEGRPAEVIGVVADVAYQELEAAPFPTAYFSSEQVPAGWGQLLVRTAGDAASLAPAVREAVLSLRSDLPVWDVTTLEARKAAATARTRVILALLGAFGGTALLLSAVGLWGLVAYSVTRRTREMGLRMALGARRASIVSAVASAPVLLAVVGTAVGAGASVLLGRQLRALLFEVEPGDARVRFGALVVLVAVVVVAALVPAMRATRIDPSEALRAE